MLKRIFGAVLAFLMLIPVFASSVSAADEVISKGKSYTLEYAVPIDNAYPKQAYKKEKKLTDGEKAKNNSLTDKAWLKLYRGSSVSVTIDLEEVMAISKVELGQFQYKASGTKCSRYVKVLVSEDGENFGLAGELQDPRQVVSTAQKRVNFAVKLDKSYKARYVRVVFNSDVFTYVDEVSVYGNSDAGSAAVAEPYVEEEKDFSGDIDGIKSVCLMYIASFYNVDMVKPYFAYIDKNGKAADTMFDALLFLGINTPYIYNGRKTLSKQGMKDYIKDTLSPNTNVGALNTVVGELKDDLGLDADYKYPIFLTVPKIGYSNELFDPDGDKTLKYNNIDDRCEIIKWYIDYIEAEFAKANFNNLYVKGLYWFEEGIDHSVSTTESELVKYFNDYSHDKGYKTMWIPYYASEGIDEAKSLGFDSVTMQCGYAFNNSSTEVGQAKEGVCRDAAETAKKFGLNGTEFEVDMGVSDYAKRLAKYISAAYATGVMEKGMITMYQVGTNLYQSSKGQGGSGRQIYDMTYKFISGQYKESPPSIKGGATVTLGTSDYTTGRLEVVDEDTKKGDLRIAEIEKPEGIFFSAQGSGFFEVQTNGCEPGTYTARLSVTDGSAVSNMVEITIIVEPGENDGSGEDGETSDGDANVSDDENGGSDKNNSLLWIIIASVCGLLVLAGGAFAFIKIRSSKKDK